MRILTTVWDDFIKNEVNIWNYFHDFWLRKRLKQPVPHQQGNANNTNTTTNNSNRIPVYMIRYEDLINKQQVYKHSITYHPMWYKYMFVVTSLCSDFIIACLYILLLLLLLLLLK